MYSAIPGDGKDEEFLIEALFRKNIADKKL